MNRILYISCIVLIAYFLSGCSQDKESTYLDDLKSDNIVIQQGAIIKLGEAGMVSAVPALIPFAGEDNSLDIRKSSIEAIGSIGRGNPSESFSIAVDSLIAILRDENRELRLCAIDSLGKIKDPKAIVPLLKISNDKDLQLPVINALGKIGDKRAIQGLTLLLQNSDKYVSYNALQALKKITK